MTQLPDLTDVIVDDTDEGCCKQGVHVILNRGEELPDEEKFFTLIVARINGGTHTYMFTLPLDVEAFEESLDMYGVRNYVANVIRRWTQEIPGFDYYEGVTVFNETSHICGRYTMWKQLKQADMDSADWWKK